MSTEFEFDIQDDLQVNEEYQAQSNTVRPPLPGNYSFRAEKWQFRTKKDGSPLLFKDSNGNPKYPVISLTTVEITDPMDNARKVVVFQDVPTNPFNRDGKPVSQAADLLRSVDAGIEAQNTGEVIRKVADALNAKQEFRARLDYKAYDKDYAAQMIAQLGSGATAKEKGEAYRKAEIKGYKKIRTANAQAGRPELGIYKWVGPSGNVVDVQPTLTIYFPSTDNTVKLGPDPAAQS